MARYPTRTAQGEAGQVSCDLCGLAVRKAGARARLNGRTYRFCCPGCRHVFEILFNGPDGMPANPRDTELFRACVEAGIIPAGEGGPGPVSAGPAEPVEGSDASYARQLTLRVEGMWCIACSWLIEQVLGRTRGVIDAEASFVSDLVRIRYLPQLIGPEEIKRRISRLGYRAFSLEEPGEQAGEGSALLHRLGPAAFLTANLMMISFCLYLGFFQELPERAIAYLSYPVWFLATPVVFYCGWPILKNGLLSALNRAFSMDTLISIGALAAYGYSAVQTIRGSLHLYFDTASMLVTLVLLGKYIETKARQRAAGGITELFLWARQKIRLVDGGRVAWTSWDAAGPGDVFLVRPGERVPLDGRVLAGRADLDESALTGEARPVEKGPGSDVRGGTMLLTGELTVRALRSGADSSAGQMARLMQEALAKMSPLEQLADRVTRWFVPAIITTAAGTLAELLLTGASLDAAISRSVTVLVIACPCALGIAAPLAKVSALGAGRTRGILVRDPVALERARDLDLLVFDKTGTLTRGEYGLRALVSWGADEREALGLVAAVEAGSDHFLAREILREARKRGLAAERVEDVERREGLGVSGLVRGRKVVVGSHRFLEAAGIRLDPARLAEGAALEERGMTVVYFGWGGSARGLLAFGDELKAASGRLVRGVQEQGMAAWLVSGDSEKTTRAVAGELGISRFEGGALPQGKVELIRGLQGAGHCVGMVGDGINDAPALAQADVGIALGSGANIAHQAADVLIPGDDPGKVMEVRDLSRAMVKAMRQNLLFASLYNALAVPLAVGGIASPLVAVFAMFASSLTVIGNTLRISGHRRQRLSPEIVHTAPCPPG